MKAIFENWNRFLKEEEKKTIITFDFDDTLKHTFDEEFDWSNEGATPFAKLAVELSKKHPSYIVTSREPREDSKKEIEDLVSEIGLNILDIHMVGGDKYPKLIELGSTIHFDDDEEEWKLIEENAPDIKVGKINWENGRLINKEEVISEPEDMQEDFQDDVRRGHEKMKRRLTRGGGSKVKVKGYKLAPVSRSKSAPPGYGGSLEEQEDNDFVPMSEWSEEEKENFLFWLAMLHVEKGDIKENPQNYVLPTENIDDKVSDSKHHPKDENFQTTAAFVRLNLDSGPSDLIYVDQETFDKDFLQTASDFMHEIQHVNQYYTWDSLSKKRKREYMNKFGINSKSIPKGFGDLIRSWYKGGGSYKSAPHEIEANEFERKKFRHLPKLGQEFISWWRKNEQGD